MAIALGGAGPPAPGPDLAARVDAYVGGFRWGAYTAPDAAQRRALAEGVRALLDGRAERADRALARAGYRRTEFTEAATGRRVAELADASAESTRGWGRVYLDLSARPAWSVQVPHPVSDARTEALGVDVFRAVPGGVLVLAGAHRRAGPDGSSDVAHRADTVFAAVVGVLTGRGLPGIQVHGFAEAGLPGRDAVVSPGAGRPGPAAELVADGLARAGYAVCRAWREGDGRLAGTTNVEGRRAAGAGVPWLHVELGRRLRTEPARRAVVAGVLADAARSWGPRAGQQGRRRRSIT
ncbi:hypothetical protein [Kitasatospora sp. NPDC018619]|uniref:hypothetical protein n=1 Tax=unclassified Kitasatospora TaxID=2633591 RepID=UPI00378917DA